MGLRNTIIVLVLLVIAGTYAYYYGAGSGSEQANKLLAIKPEDINRITLQYPDKKIVLEREGNGWKLVEPIKAPADSTVADQLSRTLANIDIKKTVDDNPPDLAPFGLAKPEITVYVATKKGGQLPGVEVGRTTPVGFSAYVKTTDKPAVKLAASSLPPSIKKQVDDLRDRLLMKFDLTNATRLVIERPGAPDVEVRKEGEDWVIVKPARYTADQTQVRQVLSALSNSRVNTFVNDNPKDLTQYGLDKPRLTVEVFTGKEAARQTLQFGAKSDQAGKDEVYVQRAEHPGVYTFHSWLFSDVDKTALDLRDKTVLAFDPLKVGVVAVKLEDRQFYLQRQGNAWKISDGTSGPTLTSSVSHFLDDLHSLKAKSIVEDPLSDPSKFGLNAPKETVTLTGTDGKTIGWLKLGRVDRKEQGATSTPRTVRLDYYAQSSSSTALFALNENSFNSVRTSESMFRAPTPTATATAKPTAGGTASPRPSVSAAPTAASTH